MVLAAGLGVRMRPLSLLRAKPALPVFNRPLLHWTLERLARHGVLEVVINLHHRRSSVLEAVAAARCPGLRVHCSYERELLGTGGGPRRLRRFFADEPFLLVNGDVFFDFDLTRLVRRHRASGARATLALKPNPDPRRYGPVVTGPGGWIRSIAGLPRPARGKRSLFTGVHVLDPVLLERLPAGASDNVRDLYAPLIAAGERLLGARVRGAWHDLGSPALYLASQLSLLASAGRRGRRARALVDPTTRVAGGALLDRAVVGGGGKVGARARISESVLWERVRVGAGARISGSIVTDGVQVPAGARLAGVIARPRVGGGIVCEALGA